MLRQYSKILSNTHNSMVRDRTNTIYQGNKHANPIGQAWFNWPKISHQGTGDEPMQCILLLLLHSLSVQMQHMWNVM